MIFGFSSEAPAEAVEDVDFSIDGMLEHSKFSPTMPFSVASMMDSGIAIVGFVGRTVAVEGAVYSVRVRANAVQHPGISVYRT